MIEDNVFERYASHKNLLPLNLQGLPRDSSSACHIQDILNRVLVSFDKSVSELNLIYQKIGFPGVDLRVGFVVDNRVFARATIFDGKDIICVSSGLALLIRNTFIRFAIDGIYDSMFSGSGFHESNYPPIGSRVDSLSELDGISEVSTLDINAVMPAIDQVIETALLFIMHHELAHIWNGHFGWLCAKGDDAEFSDGYDIEASSVFDNYRHALERDADGRAVHAIMIQLLNLDLVNNAPVLVYPENTNAESWTDFLIMMILSLVTTFILTNYAMSNELTLEHSKNYPSFTTRKACMIQNIRYAYENMPQKPLCNIEGLIKSAERASAFGLANAFGIERKLALDHFCSKPLPSIEVADAFDEMRPLLEKAKRGKFLLGFVRNQKERDKKARSAQVRAVIEKLVREADLKISQSADGT